MGRGAGSPRVRSRISIALQQSALCQPCASSRGYEWYIVPVRRVRAPTMSLLPLWCPGSPARDSESTANAARILSARDAHPLRSQFRSPAQVRRALRPRSEPRTEEPWKRKMTSCSNVHIPTKEKHAAFYATESITFADYIGSDPMWSANEHVSLRPN